MRKAQPCEGLCFFNVWEISSYELKKAPQGSHCGGYEICRKSDPPQAENLASEILFYRAPCSARRTGMRDRLTM